jgi:hypothetical protein
MPFLITRNGGFKSVTAEKFADRPDSADRYANCDIFDKPDDRGEAGP